MQMPCHPPLLEINCLDWFLQPGVFLKTTCALFYSTMAVSFYRRHTKPQKYKVPTWEACAGNRKSRLPNFRFCRVFFFSQVTSLNELVLLFVLIRTNVVPAKKKIIILI